jgi:hypothetical protein
MRTFLFTSIVMIGYLFHPLASIAQSDSTAPVLRKSLWRAGLYNFVRPGLSHEWRITRKISLSSVANLRSDYIRPTGAKKVFTRVPMGLGNDINVRLLWGIQRQLPPKRFYYDFSAGLQVNTYKQNRSLHGSLTAQLSIA